MGVHLGGGSEINNSLEQRGEGGAPFFFRHTGDQNSFFIKMYEPLGTLPPPPDPLLLIHFLFLFLQTNKILSFCFLNRVNCSLYSSVAV